jgi:hypothetical protein
MAQGIMRRYVTTHNAWNATCPPVLTTLAIKPRLVEETNDLARHVLPTGLLVVHDASRRGQDDIAELTGREQLDDPLLELGKADVVPGGDDTALVQAIPPSALLKFPTVKNLNIPAVELNNNLAGPVVVDLGEFTDEA